MHADVLRVQDDCGISLSPAGSSPNHHKWRASGAECTPEAALFEQPLGPDELGHDPAMRGAEPWRSDPQLVEEDEFAKALGRPATFIAKLVANGTLFVVERNGARLYPSFFADTTLERRQLSAVVRLLRDLDNCTKWQFFISGKGSLGGLTPLQALRQGKLRQVKVTAEGFVER